METDEQFEQRKAITQRCLEIGQAIKDALMGGRFGFALLMFDFGDSGNLAYMSTGEREDMVTLLREMADRLETSEAPS